jgi:hypothetical protein
MNSRRTDESELDLETSALSEVIKEIMPLLQEQVGLYGDLRRQFFESTVRKPDLSSAACKIAEFNNQDSVNLQQLTMQLGLIGQLLRQLQFEREGAIKSSQDAIQALQAENNRLRSELSNYRIDDTSKHSRSYSSRSPWSLRANFPLGNESPS